MVHGILIANSRESTTAIGTKRTLQPSRLMSAIGGKAGMPAQPGNVG
jgi:hypothetical protein